MSTATLSTPTFSGAEVGRHYDSLDRFYRQAWGEHVHHGLWLRRGMNLEEASRAMVDVVAARAQLRPGMSVVDIGCGYGATARLLAKEREVAVTGVTISEAQYWYAEGQRDEAAENLRFVHGDWLENELPDESQDALIAIESIEHMADKAAAFRQAWRVLKPGGRLIVCAWTAGKAVTAGQRRRLLEPIQRGARLAELEREADFVARMTETGLSVTACDDVTERVAPTWRACAWRFLRAVLHEPRHARILWDWRHENHGYARCLPRLWRAKRAGAIRYVIYCAQRPRLE